MAMATSAVRQKQICTDRHSGEKANRQNITMDRHAHKHAPTDRQAGRQKDRQAGRQTERQTDRPTDRQADSPAGRPADRQAGREAGRQAGRHRQKDAGRETGLILSF